MVGEGRGFAALVKFQNPAIQITQCYLHKEARPVVDFKVWGENRFLGGEDFCFYFMFETIFSERNKLWGVGAGAGKFLGVRRIFA